MTINPSSRTRFSLGVAIFVGAANCATHPGQGGAGGGAGGGGDPAAVGGDGAGGEAQTGGTAGGGGDTLAAAGGQAGEIGEGGAPGGAGISAAGGAAGPPDAGVVPDAAPVAGPGAALDGFRWECPCANFKSADVCFWDTTVFTSPMKVDRAFGGDPSVTYDFTFRIRGLVEPKTYQVPAGSPPPLSTTSPYFVAGVPSSDPYQVYGFRVSNPARSYYFNAYHRTEHKLYLLDYTATVPVRGGATISLIASDANGEAIANFEKLVVEGVAPAPAWYNGQFVQMNVVSAVPAAASN